MKLNIRAFALTCGILWGIGVFLFTWWVMFFEGATGEATILGMMYRGYRITVGGSFVGLAWGFFDGLICGVIFAWLYNRISSDEKNVAKNK